jgi:hypothetical protein
MSYHSKRRRTTMRSPILAILLLPVLAFAADSPFDGTWKMDLSTAQFPNVWVLKDGMYEQSAPPPKYNIKADGTDQPVPGRDYDTNAVKVVDDKTVEFTAKKGGKVFGFGREIVSEDGKQLTANVTEYPSASKQPVAVKHIYSRVAAGPPGSHAISGSWIQKVHKVSTADNSFTVTIKSTPNGRIYSNSAGRSYDAKFDGRDYPMEGAPAGTTVLLTKVDNHTITSTLKQDGKVVEVSTMTVSADGKTVSVKEEYQESSTTGTYTLIKQ